MIRTLRMYLAKDLAKATALAGISLTLVMTILAVIEPLRSKGLTGQQALVLFVYTIPLMVSVTLPIAALLAATVVYGRFSQDNELMACRASGISTLSLLAPALWLGLAVCGTTLALSLYVAPDLLDRTQKDVKANIKEIAFHALQTNHNIRWERRIIHADAVQDPESGVVQGLVAIEFPEPRTTTTAPVKKGDLPPTDVRCLVASNAQIDFVQRDGHTYAVFRPTKPAVFRQSGGTSGMEEEQQLMVEVPETMQEDARLYNWDRLLYTHMHPERNPLIQGELEKIKRELATQRFYADLTRSIQDRRKYTLREFAPPGTQAGKHWVAIEAGDATGFEGNQIRLGPLEIPVSLPASAPASAPAGKVRAVVIREYNEDRLLRTLFAHYVRVRGSWNKLSRATMVTLALVDVDMRYPGEEHEPSPLHRDEYLMGPFAVPPEISASTDDIDPTDLYFHPEKYADVPNLKIANVQRSSSNRLLCRVESEMHRRLAYGSGCFFLVVLGAALGLWLRGGHMLAAFGIALIPGGVMGLFLLAGMHMMSNPRMGSTVYGATITWSGVALLIIATVYVYAVPMRR